MREGRGEGKKRKKAKRRGEEQKRDQENYQVTGRRVKGNKIFKNNFQFFKISTSRLYF